MSIDIKIVTSHCSADNLTRPTRLVKNGTKFRLKRKAISKTKAILSKRLLKVSRVKMLFEDLTLYMWNSCNILIVIKAIVVATALDEK